MNEPGALVGRKAEALIVEALIELWPFSQGEIDGTPDRFVDAAFTHGPGLRHTSRLRRRDYLSTLIARDITELSAIPRTTLTRYLDLLSAIFLIKQIPAWSTSHTHRAVGTPKLAYVDSGIACHLLGQDAANRAHPHPLNGYACDRPRRWQGSGRCLAGVRGWSGSDEGSRNNRTKSPGRPGFRVRAGWWSPCGDGKYASSSCVCWLLLRAVRVTSTRWCRSSRR
ncbi:hypothetical protein FDG2_1517 [Candidatus Protofrankia californiensis]|uniref:DUF4143 domain-containing protein n=1 Tax=Candidatus Protofrankia californiensis TaxID=1839754 RepID=A0A1C3NVS1_9ACTN|nr:hypothetical protein FDG2_1517 [Candidatus Protofrankia californiensis]